VGEDRNAAAQLTAQAGLGQRQNAALKRVQAPDAFRAVNLTDIKFV
jgi:hypothetical protein